MSADDRCLSVRQLAERWSVSQRKIRAMIRSGRLEAFDVGHGREQWRISPEAIKAAEERMSVKRPVKPRRLRVAFSPEVEAILGA